MKPQDLRQSGGNEPRDGGLAELSRDRRALHRIPELGFDVPETLSYLRRALAPLTCTVLEPCPSTVCALFDLGRARTVAIRSDIDALPIEERGDAARASAHRGRMHACGHDGHMAMALGVARWVDALMRGSAEGMAPNELPRNVLVVFQPAEETEGGARPICDSGVLAAHGVDRIFGFHLWPDLPAGAIASRAGALLARACEVMISYHGASSHVARWREGRDALSALARFLVGSKWLSTRLAADEPCIVRFGRMRAGSARNAIASEARAEGSLRVFSEAMLERARSEMEALARLAAHEEGCTFDLRLSAGYPAVVNDRALFEEARRALPDLETLPEPSLIAEDFSFYQRCVPGVFLLLGTGPGSALHTDTFDFDETVLARGLDAYRCLLRLG